MFPWALVVLFAVGMLASTALAQTPHFALPLTVTDGTASYVLALGIVPNTNFCIVETDSINGLAELFLPPTPPSGVFDARFVWPRSGSNPVCFDQGSPYDFRPYTSATQKDTFRVKCQLGVGTTMVFSWSRRDVHFGSLTLRYFDQNLSQNVNVDMLADSTADVTANGDPATVNFYSANPLTGVQPVTKEVPTTFALTQNYPNPFNPTTTLAFSIPQAARTEIAVYDVLGRKVATLASELKAPGYYSVQWDGRNSSGTSVASGVYFVRMTARPDNGTGFSAMRKLLLMK